MYFTNKPLPVLKGIAIGVALLSGQIAHAQTPSNLTKASASELTIQLLYQSPLEGYQRYTESKIEAWRQSNQTVEEIGGWRTYAKEQGDQR